MIEDYFKYVDENGEIHLDKEKFNCFKQCLGYSLTPTQKNVYIVRSY